MVDIDLETTGTTKRTTGIAQMPPCVEATHDDIESLQELSLDTRPDPETVKHYETYFKELLKKNDDIQFVVLPTTIGAGHLRQAVRIQSFLDSLDGKSLMIPLEFNESPSIFAKGQEQLYKIVQRLSPARIVFNKLISVQTSEQVTNTQRSQWNLKDVLNQKLEQAYKDGHIDRKKRTIFVSTHAVGALSAGSLMAENAAYDNASLVECIPDPWIDNDLRYMTANLAKPLGEDRHFVVVHNRETADELAKLDLSLGKTVLPWGTVSPHQTLRNGWTKHFHDKSETKEPQPEEHRKPLHIFIEWSGNPIPEFDDRIVSFITAHREAIEHGEMEITFHTMIHKKSHELIQATLTKYGLHDKANIRLFYNELDGVQKRFDILLAAVKKREEILTGGNEYIPMSDFVLSKSGETALDDTHAPYGIVCISAEHEKRDLESGIRERRTVYLYENPKEWMKQMSEFIVEYRDNPPPPSYAHFAVLAPLEPKIISRFRVK